MQPQNIKNNKMKNYDKLFMDIAERTAEESNCVKYKVGCVIVLDNRVIIQGYNGTVPGFTNCSDKFPDGATSEKNKIEHRIWGDSFELHAEMNCIIYAAKKGIPILGTWMYCTHKPCNNCLKHIIAVGITKVVYKYDYEDNNKIHEITELLSKIQLIKKS